jgi:bacillolysin
MKFITAVVVSLAASLAESKKSSSVFIQGTSLGTLANTGLQASADVFNPAAPSTLVNILKQHGASGKESFKAGKEINNMVKDKLNRKHYRMEQTYQGIPVVDAAMVLHVDSKGQVFAINGEFVTDGTVNLTERVTCKAAFAPVLAQYGPTAVWLTTTCNIVIVLDSRGNPHKAYERMIGYQPVTGPYQNDKLYVSVVTGEIVATRPQVLGALSLKTQDCLNAVDANKAPLTNACTTIASNNTWINSSDNATLSAHKFARATYNFYWNNFGRDSLNGKGMQILTHVHVGKAYNNAYWNGASINLGDGDGKLPLL